MGALCANSVEVLDQVPGILTIPGLYCSVASQDRGWVIPKIIKD